MFTFLRHFAILVAFLAMISFVGIGLYHIFSKVTPLGFVALSTIITVLLVCIFMRD